MAVVPAAMLSLLLGHFSPKKDFKTCKDMIALWLITAIWLSPGHPELIEWAGKKPVPSPPDLPLLERANGD